MKHILNGWHLVLEKTKKTNRKKRKVQHHVNMYLALPLVGLDGNIQAVLVNPLHQQNQGTCPNLLQKKPENVTIRHLNNINYEGKTKKMAAAENILCTHTYLKHIVETAECFA